VAILLAQFNVVRVGSQPSCAVRHRAVEAMRRRQRWSCGDKNKLVSHARRSALSSCSALNASSLRNSTCRSQNAPNSPALSDSPKHRYQSIDLLKANGPKTAAYIAVRTNENAPVIQYSNFKMNRQKSKIGLHCILRKVIRSCVYLIL